MRIALCFLGFLVLPVQASGAPKQEPLLTPIDKAHCIRLYDEVEMRLKGTGEETVSTTTRNGLKDFFVTRPGVVDCTGTREIPWRDDKDRQLIAAVIKATNEAFKSNVDMGKDYGLGPAANPVTTRRP
jgi:hypothetical protein